MSVEGSVSEAFAVVLPEKLAVAHSDVVDLISGAAPVHLLPLLRRLLALSVFQSEETQSDLQPPGNIETTLF